MAGNPGSPEGGESQPPPLNGSETRTNTSTSAPDEEGIFSSVERAQDAGEPQPPVTPPSDTAIETGDEAVDVLVKAPEIARNASVEEQERLQIAEQKLGSSLTPEQQQAILNAHQVGVNELGKNAQPAGVFNYTQEHLSQKARILKEAGFSKEQRRRLMESGIVGALPATEFASFDPTYTDPKLSRIATRVKVIGDAGGANEELFYKTSDLVRRLNDEAEVDSAEAQDLLDSLDRWLTQADDPLFPYREGVRVEQQAAREGGGEFNLAKLTYNYYLERPVPADPALQQELQRRVEQSRERVERLTQEAENHPTNPLKIVTDELVEFYKKVRRTRPRELQGRGRQDTIDNGRGLGPQQERIWDDYAPFKSLKARFLGLAGYAWDGVVLAINNEEKRIQEAVVNPVGERIFNVVKRKRDRDRVSSTELRYTQTESWYGGEVITILSWPESARDMIFAAMDWFKDRVEAIGERDPGTISKQLEDIRIRGPILLENSRIGINSEEVLVAENGKILPTDPEYQRSRAFTEGMPDVIGNEKIMKKGNTEFGPQAKERFAANFIANFNGAYLENRKAAYLMHKLRRYKNGTYWMGQPLDTEKLEEGEISDYRDGILEDLVEDAANHDFFTEIVFAANQDLFPGLVRNAEDAEDVKLFYKGFFELREKYNLRYNADDPLERLLLDPGNLIRGRIAATGDTEVLKRHDLRVAVFRRTKQMLDEEDGLGYVTNDQRRLMARRLRRQPSTEELMELAEQAKAPRRAQLQEHLRSQGLDPDQYSWWIEDQLMKDIQPQRQEMLRNRIRREMERKSQKSGDLIFTQMSAKALAEFDAAKTGNDLAACDKIVWDWVRKYNDYRIEHRWRKWYPTGWDRVRIKIDRSAKVIDRALSEEEFEAMYEQIQLPQVADDNQEGQARLKDIIKGHNEDSRFGFEIARSFQIFLMESSLLGGMRTRLKDPKTGEYTGRLPDDETSLLLGMIREIGRDAEDKPIYETLDPNRKVIRIWDVVEARLVAAIEAEAKVIEQAKREKAEAITSGNQALIKEKADRLRRLLADGQFVATHALKAKGLVNGRWPVWSHNFLENATIKAFTTAMAEYGVETSVGNYISHDSKPQLYEYWERGRRALVSEMIRAHQEFMVGTVPVYEHDENGDVIYELLLKDGEPVLGENGQQQRVPKRAVSLISSADAWGEPGSSNERNRMVSKGDVAENTMVTEAEYGISTSGGVKCPELNPGSGLGFFPLGIWLAAPSMLDLNNYIKRRNEVEYHRHRFFDVKDAPMNAKAQAAAYIARRALTGGSLGEGKPTTPGWLNEPFHGAFKIADLLFSWNDIVGSQKSKLGSYGMEHTKKYMDLRGRLRAGGTLSHKEEEELEKARQLSYLDFDKMYKGSMQDPLYTTTYEVLDYFVWYLQAEKEVEQNRIGNAPRNYVYDNTLKWYDFRRQIRRSVERGDRGFIARLGYAGEVANEMVIKMMEVGLHDADYLILRDYERDRLALEGAEILSNALTSKERQAGFIIPDEKNWSSQPEPIRKALEDIRRRGLLEFMREEGYKIVDVDKNGKAKKDLQNEVVYKNFKGEVVHRTHNIIYFKEVLGNKIPPLAQRELIKNKKDSRLLAAA